MALQPLAPLKGLQPVEVAVNLLPGPGSTGPGTTGGPSIGGPAIGIDLGSIAQPVAGAAASQATYTAANCSLYNPLTWGNCIANQLLRIVLLILGILCIAGAIYLYKPTNNLIVQPAKKAAGHAAAALAETAE